MSNDTVITEKVKKIYSDFEEYFEELNSYFDQHSIIANEIVEAKNEYFQKTGKINETDENFSNRMNAFLLWFFYDWHLSGKNISPHSYFINELEMKKISADKSSEYYNQKQVHSLFSLLKKRKNKLIVKDIITGNKYKVYDDLSLIGYTKGSLFETRLFESEEDLYFFCNYFIHHPYIVRKGIKKAVKKTKKQKKSIKSLLLQLHSFHTKWTKYRNINIKSIYHFDKSVPEAK